MIYGNAKKNMMPDAVGFTVGENVVVGGGYSISSTFLIGTSLENLGDTSVYGNVSTNIGNDLSNFISLNAVYSDNAKTLLKNYTGTYTGLDIGVAGWSVGYSQSIDLKKREITPAARTFSIGYSVGSDQVPLGWYSYNQALIGNTHNYINTDENK